MTNEPVACPECDWIGDWHDAEYDTAPGFAWIALCPCCGCELPDHASPPNATSAPPGSS